jgi:protein-tyrosine phosphatase
MSNYRSMTQASGSSWPRGRARHGGIDPVPVGTARLWLAGRRYVAPDADAALASVGASTVVCLCEEPELAERWPGYVEWLRAPASPAIWHPVPDLHAPSLEEVESLVDAVMAALDRGDVIVHCGAGYGRAGTVAAAVLMSAGATMDEALGTVADARPGAGPEVGAQMQLLEDLRAAARQ